MQNIKNSHYILMMNIFLINQLKPLSIITLKLILNKSLFFFQLDKLIT
jgi:hypothetical protein